ncbi:hypothetical protein IQ62_42735 [Streptomyces scabiei]|nr:hypothetical protein IQ62_42735 [Streptomyces scabiei]
MKEPPTRTQARAVRSAPRRLVAFVAVVVVAAAFVAAGRALVAFMVVTLGRRAARFKVHFHDVIGDQCAGR